MHNLVHGVNPNVANLELRYGGRKRRLHFLHTRAAVSA